MKLSKIKDRRTLTVAALLSAAALTVAGCGVDTSSPGASSTRASESLTESPRPRKTSPPMSKAAACEKAFRAEYRRAVEEQTDGERPPECKSLPRSTQRRIARKVIFEETPEFPAPGREAGGR